MSQGTPFFLLEQTPFNAGVSLPGAKLYFYQTGTTTDQAVYQEPSLTTAHSNPVVANASGVFDDIYLDPRAAVDYRVRLTDADDNQIWQVDGVPRYRENFETGTYTCTYTGFSANPSATTVTYYKMGRIVCLELPVGTGTSNSNAFTIGNLPTALQPTTDQYCHVPYATDNGSIVAEGAVIRVSNSLTVSKGGVAFATNTWTASGTKGLNTYAAIWYRLDDS